MDLNTGRYSLGDKTKGFRIKRPLESAKKPTTYDVLSCITKSDPGSLEEFCGDLGYDTDSRKAMDIYIAVQKEWHDVERMFSDCLDELQGIN
jgi:hypothetical protein